MASGDTLFVLDPQSSTPPGTVFATHDTISDGSSPTLTIPVLDFDGATDEHADWWRTVPSHYASTTGFTFSYKYAVDGTDVDIVELEFRVLKLADLDILTGDLGIDTQTAAALQDTPAATSTNKLNVTGTVALAKANMGTPAAGDRIVIRVTRDISAATNTDDLQLVEVFVKET